MTVAEHQAAIDAFVRDLVAVTVLPQFTWIYRDETWLLEVRHR